MMMITTSNSSIVIMRVMMLKQPTLVIFKPSNCWSLFSSGRRCKFVIVKHKIFESLTKTTTTTTTTKTFGLLKIKGVQYFYTLTTRLFSTLSLGTNQWFGLLLCLCYTSILSVVCLTVCLPVCLFLLFIRFLSFIMLQNQFNDRLWSKASLLCSYLTHTQRVFVYYLLP